MGPKLINNIGRETTASNPNFSSQLQCFSYTYFHITNFNTCLKNV
jgi:hypothetical protein